MTAEDGGSLSALAGPTTDEAMAAEPGSPRMPAPIGVERPRHARRRRNRRRIKWSLAVLIVVVLLSSGLLAAQRVSRPLAQPTLPTDRHSYSLVRGSAPALPWPIAGQAAVAIPSLGYAQQSGLEGPVPIASLTKMATAVVILHDHPVALNASGPSITITAADAAQFDVDLQTDQTNVPLQVGETLTEMQMLEALLNQSADDIAYSIAVWDAGTESAFVTKMNSLATSLGAVHTHYVDASGFQPQSVSTAADSLRIAAAGMAIPAFADVVGMPTVSLPLVGTVHNIVTEVGTNGVVGVKSGYTAQSAGCMVLAGYRTIRGRSVLVMASALAQREQSSAAVTSPPTASSTTGAVAATPASTMTTAPYSALEAQYPLRYTGPLVENLLDAAEAAVVPVAVAKPGSALGTATSDWDGIRHEVPAIASQASWLLGVPGQRVVLGTMSLAAPKEQTPHNQVGAARFTLGKQIEIVPLRLLHTVAEPAWWWKLIHS